MPNASIYFTVNDVSGKHDVMELKRELGTLPGVSSVSVNDKTESIAVDFDTTAVQEAHLKNRVEKLGYDIIHTHLDTNIM